MIHYPYRAGYKAGGPAFLKFITGSQRTIISDDDHLERMAYSEACADSSQRDYDSDSWPLWREGFVDRWLYEWDKWKNTGIVRVEIGVSGPSCSGASCGTGKDTKKPGA